MKDNMALVQNNSERRYFLHISFEGTKYHGWQRQSKVISVQEVIEDVLNKIFKYEISAYGCGRTDKGVHASQFVIQINLDQAPEFDLKFRLNKNLPEDIAVYEIFEVDKRQHCRYNASSRTYDYFLHFYKDPFLQKYSSYYDLQDLDYPAMQAACSLLTKHTDFKALCIQPLLYDNTLCRIVNSKLYIDKENQRMRFSITANRFLRGMIRLSIYFVLEIGQGKMTLEKFDQILTEKLYLEFKKSALPNGLFLSRIEYSFLKLENRSSLFNALKKGLGD